MTTGTANKKRMDLAFAALMSDDDEQILTALTRIEQDGDARAIRPLLTALMANGEGKVRQRITDLLYAVKAPDAPTELLTVLEDPAFGSVRPTVIASFWNAGIDVRDYLDRFVELALTGTPAECFECLTVIENQEIWPEKATRLALAKVKKALPAEADEYKAAMLSDLVGVLEFRLGVED